MCAEYLVRRELAIKISCFFMWCDEKYKIHLENVKTLFAKILIYTKFTISK